jgi:hypothetical protein
MAGNAAECRDQGATFLSRHGPVRRGQEARAAGLPVVLAEADRCQAQVPHHGQSRAIASSSDAPDRTVILSRGTDQALWLKQAFTTVPDMEVG